MSFAYHLCGYRIASEVALPDLLPWAGADSLPEIEITLGPVPDRLPDLHYDAPFLQLGGDRDARVTIPAVASFRIEQGSRITVAPAAGGESAAIPLFLLRAAAPLLWLQRGLFAMRASAVEMDGRVVALAGGSGVGKSTLTAALLQAGHRLLSDDLTVIDSAADPVLVLPTSPMLRLWRDSLDALGIVPWAAVRRDPAMQKFEHRADTAFIPQPRPLSAICYLEPLHVVGECASHPGAAPASGIIP